MPTSSCCKPLLAIPTLKLPPAALTLSAAQRRRMFIQTQPTPNPASLMFIPGQKVMEAGSKSFTSAREAMGSPLAKKLFAIDGVTQVGVVYKTKDHCACGIVTFCSNCAACCAVRVLCMARAVRGVLCHGRPAGSRRTACIPWAACSRMPAAPLPPRSARASTSHLPPVPRPLTQVFFGSDFVTVTKSEDYGWAVLKPDVFAAIMDHYSSGEPLFYDSQVGRGGGAGGEW